MALARRANGKRQGLRPLVDIFGSVALRRSAEKHSKGSADGIRYPTRLGDRLGDLNSKDQRNDRLLDSMASSCMLLSF